MIFFIELEKTYDRVPREKEKLYFTIREKNIKLIKLYFGGCFFLILQLMKY